MTVEELEDLLARCPHDLPVIVRGSGSWAQHVETVDRMRAGQFRRLADTTEGLGPTLILGGRGTVWFKAAPLWVARGPWRGRADLPWAPMGSYAEDLP